MEKEEFPCENRVLQTIAKCYRQDSASCKCLLATVTAHATPQLAELGKKSWLQAGEHEFHEMCALQAAHRLLPARSGGTMGRELLLWDELISHSTRSQLCPAKAFGG